MNFCDVGYGVLQRLKRTHADTGFTHEFFNEDNPTKFTWKCFAWADTLFGAMGLKVATEHPDLLKQIL